jgi:cell division protein FtsB
MSTELQVILAVIGAITLAALAVFYVFSSVRKQDMEVLRTTNDDLRKNIDDKGREIRDMKVEMQNLRDRVDILEKSNKTLEDIFRAALAEYFQKHPEIASRAKGSK